MTEIAGIAVIDKPAGCSSARAVAQTRALFGKVKAGHAGTLDPAATGVLPVMLGEAPAFSRFLHPDKAYRAEICFGVATDTGDAEGEVVFRGSPPQDLAGAVRSALPEFCGTQRQTAPAHSALKHRGRPLYYYARRGLEAPAKTREVHAHALRLESAAGSCAVVNVQCGPGFYVRSLARDLGERLGCGAHLATLRRTSCSSFGDSEADAPEALEEMPPAERLRRVAPLERALQHLPPCEIGEDAARSLGRGAAVRGAYVSERLADGDEGAEQVRLLAEGRLAGAGLRRGQGICPQKMLTWTRA